MVPRKPGLGDRGEKASLTALSILRFSLWVCFAHLILTPFPPVLNTICGLEWYQICFPTYDVIFEKVGYQGCEPGSLKRDRQTVFEVEAETCPCDWAIDRTADDTGGVCPASDAVAAPVGHQLYAYHHQWDQQQLLHRPVFHEPECIEWMALPDELRGDH